MTDDGDARIEGLRLLFGAEGQRLLASLPPYAPAGELALQTTLRDAGFDPRLVSAALAQSALRAKATDKFGPFAEQMMFTADGLEQATRLPVAARHASRFLRAEIRVVHDLGCGIGSDAMALAGLDVAVRAVDTDPATAAVAAYNLRHWPSAHVAVGLAEQVRLPSGQDARHAGAWFDPARRQRGVADLTGRTRRVFALDSMSPPWAQVQSVAAALPATGAKLAPGFPHADVPAGAEAQWTSWEGEVVECAVWWGPLAQTPGRTAAVCRHDAPAVLLTEADAADSPPALHDPSSVRARLYEPDRAVIRAGLTGALSRLVEGAELDDGVGYVTSDRSVQVPWARRYDVLAALPWHVKPVRAWLRARDIGRLTIKKRGVSLDPDVVRKQLSLKGSGEATLVLTRAAGAPYVLVVQPS